MPRYKLRLLIVLTALASPLWGQEQVDPGEALYGQWEIVEMVHFATVQDFGGKPGGCFEISKNGFDYHPGIAVTDPILTRRFRRTPLSTCRIRPGEMDIQDKYGKDPPLTKAKYELKDGKLRVAWREDYGDRPDSFDEAYKDRKVTLFVLKKVK